MEELQEIWVQPLGREDTLEEGMAAHCRILAWRTPLAEEPGYLACIHTLCFIILRNPRQRVGEWVENWKTVVNSSCGMLYDYCASVRILLFPVNVFTVEKLYI